MKTFEAPEFEIQKFFVEDVITTSDFGGGTGAGGDNETDERG